MEAVKFGYSNLDRSRHVEKNGELNRLSVPGALELLQGPLSLLNFARQRLLDAAAADISHLSARPGRQSRRIVAPVIVNVQPIPAGQFDVNSSCR